MLPFQQNKSIFQAWFFKLSVWMFFFFHLNDTLGGLRDVYIHEFIWFIINGLLGQFTYCEEKIKLSEFLHFEDWSTKCADPLLKISWVYHIAYVEHLLYSIGRQFCSYSRETLKLYTARLMKAKAHKENVYTIFECKKPQNHWR